MKRIPRYLAARTAEDIAKHAVDLVPSSPFVDKGGPVVKEIVERVTTQDPWWKSKRVYTSAAALLVLILGVFGIEASEATVVEILGALATLATIVLPLLSKRADLRQVRDR